MLEKLDTVCRQAQELSAEIRQKMTDRKRGDHQSSDIGQNALRRDRSKKT
jgi:hypothetical protein